MDSALSVKGVLGEDFVKLAGRWNHMKWVKQVEPIAHLNNVWGFYRGKEDVIDKPDLNEFIKASASPAMDRSDQVKVAIILYEEQVKKWERVQFALALLIISVEPYIHKSLRDSYKNNPHTMWVALQDAYKPDFFPVFPGYAALDDLKSQALYKSLSEYFTQASQNHYNFKEAGGKYTYVYLRAGYLFGLPSRFHGFVPWYLKNSEPVDDEYLWEDFCNTLFRFAKDNGWYQEEQEFPALYAEVFQGQSCTSNPMVV